MKTTNLTGEEAEKFVSAQSYAHLACCESNIPYVVCITYLCTNGSLYGYTHEGKKIDILRKNAQVAVSIVQIEGKKWQSVIVYGVFEELSGSEKATAMEALGHHFAKANVYIPFNDMDFSKTNTELINQGGVVYRINIASMTGKKYDD